MAHFLPGVIAVHRVDGMPVIQRNTVFVKLLRDGGNMVMQERKIKQPFSNRPGASHVRYGISRSARSETRESLPRRLVSLLLRQKCLAQAEMLWDWMPRTMAEASLPATSGSSE